MMLFCNCVTVVENPGKMSHLNFHAQIRKKNLPFLYEDDRKNKNEKMRLFLNTVCILRGHVSFILFFSEHLQFLF